MTERIEKAALMKDGRVFSVERPGRHDQVIRFAHTTLGLSTDPMEPLREDVQGFVTNSGRFVDRFEAVGIAVKAGQIAGHKYKLYSEDVWDKEGRDIMEQRAPDFVISLRVVLADMPLDVAIDAFESLYLKTLLTQTKGGMTAAAEIAGVDRRTILRKTRKHGINPRHFKIEKRKG